MENISKIIVFVGIAIVLFGLLLPFLDKIPFLGKLPGDIYIKRDNGIFYFPLTTSILVSVVLSLLIRLFNR